MTKVRDILAHKGTQVHTIQKDTTIYDAVARMTDEGVGSLVVMDGDQISGIVTERDYIRKVTLKGLPAADTTVAEVMTTEIIVADPDDTIEECMATMTEKRIRHLPVMEGTSLAGLVSIGDLIKQVAKEQTVHIKYLTDYITGKYPA